jgi:hypothetical protein
VKCHSKRAHGNAANADEVDVEGEFFCHRLVS